MHRLAAIPGGWSPNDDGVVFVDQSPGDLVFLSAADTELHSLGRAYADLAAEARGADCLVAALPSLRTASLLHFKRELTVDTYVDAVIIKAKAVVLRLIGGESYYPHLCDAVRLACSERKIPVLFLPGHGEPDLELLGGSTVPLALADRAWRYCEAGGRDNLRGLLRFLFREVLGLAWEYPPPLAHPELFLFHPGLGILTQDAQDALHTPGRPKAAVLGYRSHMLADNLEPFERLSEALAARGFDVLLAFAQSLREPRIHTDLRELLTDGGRRRLDLLINTTAFATKNLAPSGDPEFLFARLDVPVLQAILAGSTRQAWKDGLSGLTPADIAMNVVLPEVDGKIITGPVSFKKPLGRDGLTDSDRVRYEAHAEGCDFVAELGAAWWALRFLSNREKRIALVLPNYPNRDARLANGVGLDTPASCVAILAALKQAGYRLEGSLPESSAVLMEALTQGITNDLELSALRPALQLMTHAAFDRAFCSLSPLLREKVEKQWGPREKSPHYRPEGFGIPGLHLGGVFVGIQPSRGYNLDPQAVYHSPDLPPTYAYLAFHFWLRDVFRAHAVVHVGKHGNLEWLPGKSLALNPETCFPAALLGPLPHFYPFIVNDPGEGSQAKRRTHAVILDHLIPPMTRAETYGDLLRLENLIDEYYEAVSLDPRRGDLLLRRIRDLVAAANLQSELGADGAGAGAEELLLRLDRYLCEIKESQIRDGLHIFGKAPEGDSLVDLLIALHRVPTGNRTGLTRALARDLELALDPLACDPGERLVTRVGEVMVRTAGEAVARLEEMARAHLRKALEQGGIDDGLAERLPRFAAEARFLMTETLPALRATGEEMAHLLRGLSGRYIPSGPSGAPTRGRLDVLPTGRNFYSVDVRTVPTEAAYSLGTRSATLLVERHLQEKGEYPRSVGLSVWGTSAMRTGGDDLAQALALLGVKPVWQGANRRVLDFEVIPLILLKRPRVDVTLRISGFFRDAFPDSIALFQAAVKRVAELDEPPDMNPLRDSVRRETEAWVASGLEADAAAEKALYRVFGSKPGAYGTGLQQVLDERNWKTQEDLALVYLQWGSYAYGPDGQGRSAQEAYRNRLRGLDVVMHNQDNREHDILDSDDYYQFQGGMATAAKVLAGAMPSLYFGDHQRPDQPRVKSLKEELLKVYRSRAVNPKWLAGARRHGYKGAFEMAATLDYLFAYAATTGLVEDFMFEGMARGYLMDAENRDFLAAHNPWALKDMSERLLEAVQRGLWQAPPADLVDALQGIFLSAEGDVEARGA